MTENKKKSMSGNDYATIAVPQSARAPWTQITFVWFGAAMVAQLYQCGVTVGTGTGSLSRALIAIFCAALFLAAFTAFNGIIGYVTGCNAALNGRFSFGSIGAAIPGFHIADIGWFVVINAIFSNILATIYPKIDIRVYCILVSVLFITNNYIGFKRMVILNKIAFPILICAGLYGIYKVHTLPGGLSGVFDKVYEEKYSMTVAITMVIGTWTAGCSRSADYFRYARRAKDALIASFLGFFCGFCLCIICGAIWGAATGTTVIGDTLVILGMVGLGAFMFFVQSWTTSEHCSYVTSTALPTTIEIVTKKNVPRRYIVLLVGVVGVCITGLDIQNYYVPFISFLGYVIPVIGVIGIADYFILSKTNLHWSGYKNFYKMDVNSEEVMQHKFNPAVIPALIAGLLVGWKVTWGISAINATVVTIVVYLISTIIFNALGFRAKAIAKNVALAEKKGEKIS